MNLIHVSYSCLEHDVFGLLYVLSHGERYFQHSGKCWMMLFDFIKECRKIHFGKT